MFVRWQRHKRRRRRYSPNDGSGSYRDGDIRFSAVLVESRRVDGKPRLEHIAYLGKIHESGIPHRGPQLDFWSSVEACLARIDNRLTKDQRNRIIASLEARVRRPSSKERARAEKEAKEFAEAVSQMFPRRRPRRRKSTTDKPLHLGG